MGNKSRSKRPLKRNWKSFVQIRLAASRKALKEALTNIDIVNQNVIKEQEAEIHMETTEKEVSEEHETKSLDNNINNICILCQNKKNLYLDDPLKNVKEYRDIIMVLTGHDINNLGGKYPIKACSFCIIDLDHIKEVRARIINAQISLQNYASDLNDQLKANVYMNDLLEKDKIESQIKSIFTVKVRNAKRPLAKEFQYSMKAIRESTFDFESKKFNIRVPVDSGNGDNHHLYECVICDSSFEHGELLHYHHVIVHRGASCQCCGGKFNSLQSYLKHIYDTTANGENGGDDNFNWIKCTECNSYVTKYFVHLHKLQHQSEQNHLATNDKNTANNPKNNNGKLTKVADNTKNNSDGNFINGITNHFTDIEQNDEILADNNESNDDDSTEKSQNDKGRKLPPKLCHICGLTASYKTHNAFRVHIQTHQFVQCETCGVVKSKAMLQKHKLTHERAKITCEVCGKQLSDTPKLIKHLRIHTGEKPFSCKFCDRKFSSKWNRDGHLRLHTNDLPYKCTQCNEAFRHNVTLKKHIITSH